MDTLAQLIHALTPQELRRTKRLLQASQQGEAQTRKDMKLLDGLRRLGPQGDDSRLRSRLYPDTPAGRNAYYRLKNRLQERLLQALVWLQGARQPESEVLVWLMAARVLIQRNRYTLGLQLLQKAERTARRAEAYEALDQVYSETVLLADRLPNLDPQPYIAARRENLQRLDRLRRADELLAVLNYRLRRSQTYTQDNTPVLELLRQTLDEWQAQSPQAEALSPKLRFKVIDLMTTHLLQEHDYPALLDYCRQSLVELEQKGLFTKTTHSYKLRLLTYLVNSAFLLSDHHQSLAWAGQLAEAMEAYNRQHYDRYAIFYYNALLINYYVLDIDRAIQLLQEMRRNQALKNQPIYEVFLLYNYAICWFKKRNYASAIQEMTRLRIHPDYAQLEEGLRLKIALAELAIRYDRQEPEVFEQRLQQIRREFKTPLSQPGRDSAFLDLLETLGRGAPYTGELPKHLQAAIHNFILEKPDTHTDVIDYAAWLEAKLPPAAA